VAGKRRALGERRRVVGHTQEQLAALLDVERSTVVRWEVRGYDTAAVVSAEVSQGLGRVGGGAGRDARRRADGRGRTITE
jgi:DNA-binding XRE family transcriptional regulator